MTAFPKSAALEDTGCQGLLRAVPPTARRVLAVECPRGHLEAALQQADPAREVFAIDPEAVEPPLAEGSLDGIVYDHVLGHFADPEEVLRRHRQLLRPQGTILCAVPNLQHHTVLAGLLRGDFPLSPSDRHGFTWATLTKLFLDSGFAPVFVDAVGGPCPAPFLAAARPLLEHLGLFPQRSERYLGASIYIVRGLPLWDRLPAPAESAAAAEAETPLTFVACVSDEAVLRATLLSSPCLRPGSPHEVLLARRCRSAAEGLNHCLARARNDLIVCVHQDVYLPRGWPARLVAQYRQAEAAFGPIGAAGVYGVALAGRQTVRAGHVVDRDQLRAEPLPLPAVVDTLDELLLVLRRDRPLPLDPSLGSISTGPTCAWRPGGAAWPWRPWTRSASTIPGASACRRTSGRVRKPSRPSGRTSCRSPPRVSTLTLSATCAGPDDSEKNAKGAPPDLGPCAPLGPWGPGRGRVVVGPNGPLVGPNGPLVGPNGPLVGPNGPQWAPDGPQRAPEWAPLGPGGRLLSVLWTDLVMALRLGTGPAARARSGPGGPQRPRRGGRLEACDAVLRASSAEKHHDPRQHRQGHPKLCRLDAPGLIVNYG